MDEGSGAATVQENAEASKSAIDRVALQPRLRWVQKRSRPTPYGETTPIPLIATRDMSDSTLPIDDWRWANAHRFCGRLQEMSRRMLALVLTWCALGAPAAPTPLPEAAPRAVESVSTDDLRAYVGPLASDSFNGRPVAYTAH